MTNMIGRDKRCDFQERERASRFRGLYEGELDPYGFDASVLLRWEPFFRFLWEGYFRITILGVENIPSSGRALLVGNHSGVIPLDAFLFYYAYYAHHVLPRRIRFLVVQSLLDIPGVGGFLKGIGGVPAEYSIAKELLEKDELVFIYPEGTAGTGKSFRMRYRVCDFHPGFAKGAIETGAPIIPITTIGADEIYPLLGNCKPIARLMGMPYWPITPTFPWLPFPASAVPLPIRILIKIGKPIYLNEPPERGSDRRLMMAKTKEIQYEIQRELNFLLRKRKSPFSEWNVAEIEG